MTQADLPHYLYTWKNCEDSDKFEARCCEIPDLYAYGNTPEEALHEIKEAVLAWIEVLKEDNLPLPDSKISMQRTVANVQGHSFPEPTTEPPYTSDVSGAPLVFSGDY